jgi:molybdate transport system substrate-binding protein
MKPALAAFEVASGDTVAIAFAAAPALRDALKAAPAADVIVAPQGVLDEFAGAGGAVTGPRAPIGRVGVGVAVRSGVAPPDVGSAAALKAALADADIVVFNRASTGMHVEQVLHRLGVADAVLAKSERFPDGASVMRRLLAGTSPREFGFGALTEIALFRDQGVRLVGPLPPELQNATLYVAVAWPGASPDAARAEAVAALLRHLQGAAARSQFVAAGIEP